MSKDTGRIKFIERSILCLEEMEPDRLAEVGVEAEWAAAGLEPEASAFVRLAAIENHTKEGSRASKKLAPSATLE
jgi:hypothetical protein